MKIKNTDARLRVIKEMVDYNESRFSWEDSLKSLKEDLEWLKERATSKGLTAEIQEQVTRTTKRKIQIERWIEQDKEAIRKLQQML